MSNLSVEPSDLLDGISGTFDLIVANPPHMLTSTPACTVTAEAR